MTSPCYPHDRVRSLPIAAAALSSVLLSLALALAWWAPAAAASTVAHHAGMSSSAPHATMTFEVGTPERPLVARGARGPLWRDSAPLTPGATKHGTFAEQTVAAQLEALRSGHAGHAAAADDPLARRATLTTRQATKRLSKRCRKLVRRSTKRMSKRDRARRRSCLRKRRKLIRDSREQPQTPGVSAPAAPIAGPKPTTAPSTVVDPTSAPAPAPTPNAPAPTTPTAPTPAAPTAPAKKYAAAGVTATEGSEPFRLTRASATADIVNFELENTDAQQHDLYIAPADEAGNVSGTPVKVIGRIDGGTRQSADVELAPGRYKLLCTVPGHGPMAVNFTVYAPTA